MVQLRVGKPTFTLLVAVLVAAETYLVPNVPEYFTGFRGFLSAVVAAAVVWVATEGSVPVPPTTPA